jgi:hypothetical protein
MNISASSERSRSFHKAVRGGNHEFRKGRRLGDDITATELVEEGQRL